MDKSEMAEYTLTVEEASQALGVSKSRVRQHVMRGRLVGIKRAGAWFFKPEAVKNFQHKPQGRPRKQ